MHLPLLINGDFVNFLGISIPLQPNKEFTHGECSVKVCSINTQILMPFHVIKKSHHWGWWFMTYPMRVGGCFLDDYSQPHARFDTYTNLPLCLSGEKSKQEKGATVKGNVTGIF